MNHENKNLTTKNSINYLVEVLDQEDILFMKRGFGSQEHPVTIEDIVGYGEGRISDLGYDDSTDVLKELGVVA